MTQIGLDPDNDQITNLKLGNAFDQSIEVPRVYSLLSARFTQFAVGPLQFYLSYHKRAAHFEQHGIRVEQVEKEGRTVIGMDRESLSPITVDASDTFYLGDEPLGTLCQVVGLPEAKAPLDIAEVGVSNKVIPVGLVLAYQMGLSKLIEKLNCDVARHRRGSRFEMADDEYSVVFQDEVLVFSRLDRRASLVLAGLNRYHRALRQFSVWDFDRKDVYHNVLLDQGLGVRYLREIDTLFNVWVDPITKGLLEEMGEPTDFGGLLLRSADLLLHDHAPNEVEGEYMRYRGYERMAGMVYGELARACKAYHARSHYGDAAVDLNPHQVWQRIVGDPSSMIVEEANPFTVVNEQEIMTYRGDGGRSGKSMVKRTRIYSDTDVGVVSESTLDSGDVGVVAYLAPDANFTSTRGLTRRYDKSKDGAATLLSTAALNAPCADRDDAKRIR
jgi:hypothetical protein